MTPQLQQAIKMLQLSNLELNQFIDTEIQQNPLLERREAKLDEAASANGVGARESPSPARLEETVAGEFTPEAADHWHAAFGDEGDGSLDRGSEPHFWQTRDGALDAGDRPGIEQTATRPRTLRE